MAVGGGEGRVAGGVDVGSAVVVATAGATTVGESGCTIVAVAVGTGAVAMKVAMKVAVAVGAGSGVPSSRGEASRVAVGVGTGVCGPLSAPAAPPASGSVESTPGSVTVAGVRLQAGKPIRATNSRATRNQPTRMVN